MSQNGMLAAVAMAAGLDGAQADAFVMTPETLATHFPNVAASIETAALQRGLKEGADAEHVRMTGIEAACLPGSEGIIAAHKADRSKTPADAALAVLAAERSKLSTQSKKLQDDEASLSDLKSTGGNSRGGASADAEANPLASAREMSLRAKDYIAQQAKNGVTVSAVDAVAHIQKEG